MQRIFVLRGIDKDREVGRKAYMTMEQAFVGFRKAAREHLGAHCTWVHTEQVFGGYYRNAAGDVLEMR